MKSPVRRLLPHLCAVPLALLLWAPGCAKQGEGDRCDFNRSGNQDCESGLVCVAATELVDDSTDRCCPPEGQSINDDRCQRDDSAGGSGGTGGKDAGTGGKDSGTGGTDSGSGGAAGGGGVAGGGGGTAGSGGTSGSDSGSDSASGGTSGSDSGFDGASDAAQSDSGGD